MSHRGIGHAGINQGVVLSGGENKVMLDEKLTKKYTLKRVLDAVKNVHTEAQAGRLTVINMISRIKQETSEHQYKL